MTSVPAVFQTSEADFLTEVPSCLKKLVRMVVRGFYSVPQALVIDALVRDPCIKEEDLSEILLMDKRMLRQALIILKRDRLIKAIQRTEPQETGQPKHFVYYFINFKSFVNVLKYKLDQMRRKIESEEKMARNRMFYKCPNCGKEYGDLDLNRLFDPILGILQCTHCQGEVEEDNSHVDESKSSLTVASLNELTRPLIELMKQCENIKLATEVLEPQPAPIKRLQVRRQGTGQGNAWKSGPDINLYDPTNAIQITLMDEKQQGLTSGAAPVKEQPRWLMESTVQGAEGDARASLNPPSTTSSALISSSADRSQPVAAGPKPAGGQVLADLLMHESAAAAPVPAATKRRAPEPDDSSSEDEAMAAKRQALALGARAHLLGVGRSTSAQVADQDNRASIAIGLKEEKTVPDIETMEDDDDDEETMVKVGGRCVPLSEVSAEIVAEMTGEERLEYQRLCQQLYDEYDS